MGRYITSDDIAHRSALNLTDLLRTMTGLYMQTNSNSFSPQLMMRGPGRGFCAPAVYLDGMPMYGLDSDDLDAAVQPGDITGIEVYTSTTVPPQFERPLSGCGSILVWTR